MLLNTIQYKEPGMFGEFQSAEDDTGCEEEGVDARSGCRRQDFRPHT